MNGGIIIVGRLNNTALLGKTHAIDEFLEKLPKDSYSLESIEVSDIGTLEKVNLSYITQVDRMVKQLTTDF